MLDGNPVMNADTMRGRLAHLFHPTLTEAVFADLAVLVEGGEDAAFIEAALQASGDSERLQKAGVFVVPVEGKSKLDRMVLLLQELGVPTYVVFDTDYDTQHDRVAEAKMNSRIAGVCTGSVSVAVDEASRVSDSYAVFHPNLTAHIRHVVGESDWLRTRDAVAAELGFERPKEATKNCEAVTRMLAYFQQAGTLPSEAGQLAAAIVRRAGLPVAGPGRAPTSAAP
jgi:hypothetical protein